MRSLTANDVSPMERRYQVSTDKLLGLLKEHHDYSIPAPERPIAPKPVLVTDEWVERQKAKQWFAVVEDLGPVSPRPPTVHEIVAACGQYFNLKRTRLLANRRTGDVVYARQVAMYLAGTLTGRSLPEIGRAIGGRDHSTILHGIRKMKVLVRTNWTVALDVAQVEAML